MNELKLWLQLLSTPELGRNKIRKLLKLFGEPNSFIGKKNKLIDLEFLTDQQVSYLSFFREPENWSNINKRVTDLNIEFVTMLDHDFPPFLTSIFDPPVILFYRGELSCLTRKPAIAIVGTRRPSNYGKLIAEKLSRKMAAAGFTIVSGLAYGIDSVAHRAALNTGGETAAVMATGPDMIYPPGNRSLANDIVKQGIILSEYLPGQKAEIWYFPTRNRIISGLCKGCIIVEGSRKSGALLTAKFALDQNRDIFAVPGDITRPQSEGPNFLIKSGAKPVTDIQDVLEEYDILFSKKESYFPELSSDEKDLFQLILKNRPEISFDNIVLKSQLGVNLVSSILLSLELKSVVKKIEGNKYIIN